MNHLGKWGVCAISGGQIIDGCVTVNYAKALARCDLEIREIQSAPESALTPAWLITLAIEDWEMEKRLIQSARSTKGASA